MSFHESFKRISISLKDSTIFALHSAASHPRPGKGKQVLLLLHGYPQNHTLYHVLAQHLANLGVTEEWDVVIPDLPGYGQSTKAASSDGSHYAHSKRAIAADCVSLIDALFSAEQKFVVVGHDRGARVAYRMAKDWKDRVTGACLLDIIPTRTKFERMSLAQNNHKETFGAYHWVFLALPPPLPETLISASSDFYFHYTIASWTGKRFKHDDAPESSLKGVPSLDFDPSALASWIDQYHDPAVLQGALEDYRAGATIDLVHDAEASGVECPLLVLHSVYLGEGPDVKAIWNAEPVDTTLLLVKQVGDEETGHFIPIEAAEDCAREIKEWLSGL